MTMQTDAGADGTAAAVWSDGTTVRAARQAVRHRDVRAPVAIGSGQAPDVAVGPGGRVLAVWAANDGCTRPSGWRGRADSRSGCDRAAARHAEPAGRVLRGRPRRGEVRGHGRHRRSRSAGRIELVRVEPFSLPGPPSAGAIWRSPIRRARSSWSPPQERGGVSRSVVFHLARTAPPGRRRQVDPQTDTSSMFNSTTLPAFSPARRRRQPCRRDLHHPEGRERDRPDERDHDAAIACRAGDGSGHAGDVDSVSNGGFFGPFLNSPSLIGAATEP